MQIGGQAVIEGVMMRAPGTVATAVRRKSGRIVVQMSQFRSFIERHPAFNIPVVRGAVGLVDMLVLGVRALNWSAEVAMLDAPPKNGLEGKGSSRPESAPSKSSTGTVAASLLLSLAVALGVFYVTPLVVTTRLFHVEQQAFAFNLVSGLIRIVILVGYLYSISLIKDIKRLFEYHGAEHKSIFAFELNDRLIPAAVARHTRFHPRCGTSFLLMVMFVAIVSFALLDWGLIRLTGGISLAMRLAFHLPFIPVVGGIAYECIRFSSRHTATWWGRIIVAPGLWLQGITTREPDERQIEVALAALMCALGERKAEEYPLDMPEPDTAPVQAA